MHRRFKVKENVFAVTKPHAALRGQILDISKNGLAFSYIDSTGDWSRASDEVDIFLLGTGLYMDKVRVKTISDFTIEAKNPYSKVRMRRRSIQFDGLTQKQTAQIEQFLLSHTSGKLNDPAGSGSSMEETADGQAGNESFRPYMRSA